jgi:general secretion pathway protein N
MKRKLGMSAVALAAFVLILLVRFPAQWAAGALPRDTHCEQLDGTLWSGSCSGLSAQGNRLGDLTWSLHPLGLLSGRLALDLSLTQPATTMAASAHVEWSLSGTIAARNVHANLTLDHSFFKQLPPSMHGQLDAELAALRWDGKRITELQGQLDVRGLAADQNTPLGDYRLSFPGGPGDPVGALKDIGGPLAVEGTLRLTPEPGYVVAGLVAARPSAPPDLAQQIRYLGSPDAQGRRPFSFAGTF